MKGSNLILLLFLLNPSLILMLKKKKFRSLKWNEAFIDTCCSFNENDKIYLSCAPFHNIQLKLIEIYYNSNEYCSSEVSCCKYQTRCSRRITKYSSLHCDGQNSCWIDKSCLKIYDPCASVEGLYGQYITIEYSCFPSNQISRRFNQTNSSDDEEPVPFIVKLSTSDQATQFPFSHQNSLKNVLMRNDLKSSPLFLIFIILIFLLFLFLTYYLADQFGKKICRENRSKKNVQTNTIQTKIFFEHSPSNKSKVQSNSSLPMTRIYPSYYSNDEQYPHSFNSYERYLTVHHDPFTGQFSSRSFNPYFNYY